MTRSVSCSFFWPNCRPARKLNGQHEAASVGGLFHCRQRNRQFKLLINSRSLCDPSGLPIPSACCRAALRRVRTRRPSSIQFRLAVEQCKSTYSKYLLGQQTDSRHRARSGHLRVRSGFGRLACERLVCRRERTWRPLIAWSASGHGGFSAAGRWSRLRW